MGSDEEFPADLKCAIHKVFEMFKLCQ